MSKGEMCLNPNKDWVISLKKVIDKRKTTIHPDALLSTTEGKPNNLNLRCVCTQIHSEPLIPSEKILSLRVIPAGPHCKNEEIIVTMEKGPVCLDLTKYWEISFEEEIYKRKTTIHPDALLSTTEAGKPKHLNLRCVCPQTHSEPPIPAEKILSLRVIPAGPNCKNEEIIATMKEVQMCLDPTKDWVISLKEAVIHDSKDFLTVSSNGMQEDVVLSTTSFTREKFCVM
uniref:Chemokine interleukin-8-like domain-containing protein n=1 Tax=Cyprinus carpio TaxID=7962 RepID=A0A8C2F524_CYPCA